MIGILSGPTPLKCSGMEAALQVLTGGEVGFREANVREGLAYLAHTVSRTGSFLSQEAGIREGEPLAYLIAPPVEAMTAMDAALKAADVRLAKLYGPLLRPTSAGASSPVPRAPAAPPATPLPPP